MKRAFTHKLKSALPVQHDNDALAKLSAGKLHRGVTGPLKANASETANRRARTSAAMIGLAISMGASSLLLPKSGDEAMAAEPVAAEPTVANVPAATDNPIVASPAPVVQPETTAYLPVVEPEAVTVSQPSVEETEASSSVEKTEPSVIEHQVQPGQTLWQLSQKYQVDAAAINASNHLESTPVLPSGQIVKVPSVNGIVHEVQLGETSESLSKSYGVAPNQLKPSSASEKAKDEALSVGQSVTVPGNVNDLLKARQEESLSRLKEQGNRLQESLAELRSEESTNLSDLPKIEISAPKAAQIETTLPQSSATSATSAEKSDEVIAEQSAISVPSRVIDTGSPAKTQKPAASVVVNEPKLSTVPNLVIDPAPLGTSQVVAPTVAMAEPQVQANVYAVKPGDTIDAIARAHGVSKAEIIQTNQLGNPNLIRVNQQLKIPPAQSTNQPVAQAQSANQPVALVPGLTPNLRGEKTNRVVASLAIPSLPTQGLPVTQTDVSTTSKLPRASVKPTLIAQTPVADTPTLVAKESKSSVGGENANYDPYVEKLRVEIVKLRQQYRAQQTGETAELPEEPKSAVVAAQPESTTSARIPAASKLNSATVTANYVNPVNPEFNPKQYNQAQAERQRRQQTTQQTAIKIPVPPPATQQTRIRQPLIAAAPSAPDTYNPMVQPPVGQTVSPDLPPLPGADPYLPDSPAKFNGYIWPTKGVLTSGYGRRWGRMHKGIDIAAPIGTPVVAAASGVVVYARWNSGGYGNLVDIQHSDGSVTRYAHNNRLLVREGQVVEQGQQISEMGSTGFSTGPHLHFEVHSAGKGAVNPVALLPRKR